MLKSKPKICIFWSITVALWYSEMAVSDPQIHLVNAGCSQYNVTDLSSFTSNLNAAFDELRAQLVNGDKRFATAQQTRGSDPVYAMVQCRNYMSSADCIACFQAAESQIRDCVAANGARVIYDGCFLRYESISFFDQSTKDGHSGICGNKTTSQSTVFSTTVQQLLADLKFATPKINRYFAATKRGEGNASIVYAVAQCAETLSKSGCEACMNQVYNDTVKCTPFSNGRGVDVGCFLRYSDSSFFVDNQILDIRPYLKKESSRNRYYLIGGLVGGGVFLLFLIALFLWFKPSRKHKPNQRGDILGATELQGPMNYKYKDLISATRNFSEENKLGEGGFSNVYKGVLKNGKIVAVKRLAISEFRSQRVKEDFESEVKLISNVHHRNLIRLLGCCNKGFELLLVYEFMANSSLDKFLFGERRGTLNWNQRLQIIIGIARGLAYLHEEFHECIIHRDIKSSNILLDEYFQPKIADFGLARLLPENQTHLTTKFAGTLGYTAPEYALHGQLSEKVDTYSFGIVVLEIISGQKSNEPKPVLNGDFLLKMAWKLYENEKYLDLVDENLDVSEYEAEEMKKMIEIAFLCTQSTPGLRPTMSEVGIMLRNKGPLEHTPLPKPDFINPHHETIFIEHNFPSTASSASNANASFTQIFAR